jgi:predicted metal-dependent hydrolase
MNLFTALLNKYYPIVASQGVGMPRLAIRKMKTLWGSCSTHRDVITLNFYLYKVPPECVEYIVFHELAHFLYRRHDGEFYGFIARYMPDFKERSRAVKNEYPG